MIQQEIQTLFDFIDYLDSNKSEFIKRIPLINELKLLDKQRQELKPLDNYKKRQQHNNIQQEISEKIVPIKKDILAPILNKLKELEIWSGDDTFSSIWNNNISAISDIKQNFTDEDAELILQHKQKYLSFRNETNTDFLGLGFAFNELDEVLKELFDFFKDTKENEFENFETKTIEVSNLAEAAKRSRENRGENVKFVIPSETVCVKPKTTKPNFTNIKNEIIMGNKIEVGNISDNSGKIAIGKENKIETKRDDKVAEKSFHWTIIVGIFTILGVIVSIIIYWDNILKFFGW